MLELPPAREASFAVAYEFWLASWETALAALATATHTRTLSTREAAALKAVIVDERRLVTREFTLLFGADLLENRLPGPRLRL